jgi:hypothetical protein
MSDEKFEDFLRNAARGYNTPPARTPREDMWNAIQSARSAGPRVVYGGGANTTGSGEKRFGTKVWWAAAAGIVLVASGIGIGRLTAPAPATVATVHPSVVVRPESTASNDPAHAELPSDATRNPGDARVVQSPFSPETSRAAGGQRGSREMVASSGTAGPRPISIERAEAPRSGARGTAPTLAYEMAEINHLTAAEALLTSFRTRSTEDQQQDARLAAWARELLSNTRLLLDSPVAADPQRRPLLQDLELLLVQIVQLSPGTTPQDREIMERTLKQDQLMTRLRTAIPAGQQGS